MEEDRIVRIKKEKSQFERECNNMIIIFFVFSICPIICRISEIIISIIIYSKKIFKVYYLIRDISFLIYCLNIYFYYSCFTNNNDKFSCNAIWIVILVCYILDGICYFLYFFENVDYIISFLFLISSDLISIPIFIFFITCSPKMKD